MRESEGIPADSAIILNTIACSRQSRNAYIFGGYGFYMYNNQALSGMGNLRSICIDKLEYNPDGTIKTVRQHVW